MLSLLTSLYRAQRGQGESDPPLYSGTRWATGLCRRRSTSDSLQLRFSVPDLGTDSLLGVDRRRLVFCHFGLPDYLNLIGGENAARVLPQLLCAAMFAYLAPLLLITFLRICAESPLGDVGKTGLQSADHPLAVLPVLHTEPGVPAPGLILAGNHVVIVR